MTPSPDASISDPLHTSGGLTTSFANVNSAEAWGGQVASPLGWTFFARAAELGSRQALADLGALRRREVDPPQDRNRCFYNAFYGRPGSNVALWREAMDRIWGSSGEGYDEAYHAAKGGSSGAGRRAGSAVSALRFAVVVVWSRAQLARFRKKLLPWWQARVAEGSTESVVEARAVFREAAALNRKVLRHHAQASWVAQSLLEQLKARCRGAGLEGLEQDLIASEDDFEEQALIEGLWQVSRDLLTLDELVATWGFQGPVVGELSSRSWREDPSPLVPIVEAYRRQPDEDSPAKLAGRRIGTHRDAMQKLLAGRSLRDRLLTSLIVHGARTFVPLRQVGRSTFLKTYDVARCMARRIGDHLVAEGVIDERDDVFYLTDTELVDAFPANGAEVIRVRRERQARYRRFQLPERWTGELTEDMLVRVDGGSVPGEGGGDPSEPIEGLGVSGGVVEGRAIVVDQPHAAYDLLPGDILVCVTTDPSWAAILYAVAGLVTDVGAQMSHGAIVARELGIPAVVNTGNATSRIRTGDTIHVDASTGTVRIVDTTEGGTRG